MNEKLRERLISRLLSSFDFKESEDGQWLNQGRCPQCGKKSLFTHAQNPWKLKCGREAKCGIEYSIKELYPEEFADINKRYVPTQKDPNATANAYLELIRGFKPHEIKGQFEQGSFYHPHGDKGTATVRFYIDKQQDIFMERLVEPVLITDPVTGEKEERKANFKGSHKGKWWQPDGLEINDGDEVWLVEGCLDALALHVSGIKAVAVLSCVNFPDLSLTAHKHKKVTWVWALDNDKAGKAGIKKHIRRANSFGLYDSCAALVPARTKRDWNDLYIDNQLTDKDIETYRYHGRLFTAKSALDKALLTYQQTQQNGFVLDFNHRLYWFGYDVDKYHKAYNRVCDELSNKDEFLSDDDIRAKAISECGGIVEIANCKPEFLYFQTNILTDESWYYIRCEFPNGGRTIKNTFTGGQVSACAEFKKRLLSIAPGALWTGKPYQLDWIMKNQASEIKTVDTIDFLGYSKEFGTYVFNDVAFKEGKTYEANDEDYFELPGQQAIKSLYKDRNLQIERTARNYRKDWAQLLWKAYGTKGMVAATFWFGSLFAEQIREVQASFPFLEIVGEAGSGKTTLIEFLWRLFGQNREGIDPNKGTRAGLDRSLSQFANMPTVFIEADRDEGNHRARFDWEETKPYYNGRGMRVRGIKNSGNETQEPPFRGTIVIAQNETVSASQAVLQRIVHLNFKLSDHNEDTKRAADELTALDIENLSYFLRLAISREADVMKQVKSKVNEYQAKLMERENITQQRLGLNHAQLMAIFGVFADIVELSKEQRRETFEFLIELTEERQNAVNGDHPSVAEFWETYNYLNTRTIDNAPLLNHSKDESLIAINLNHFLEVAQDHKQQIPVLRDLKRLLKTSKSHPYVEQTVVNSNIHTQGEGYTQRPKSMRCWIFKKRGHH